MRTRDQDKQQRVKDAVVQLVLREGIDGASVAKIAKEAGVSPATIYVYYSNKEQMLAEVFKEYSHFSFEYLRRLIDQRMAGPELVETIVRGYFAFNVEHEEVFSFVEQCSRCPALAEHVCEQECTCDILDLIHARQACGEVRRCSDANLTALLFAPVRHLAMSRHMLGGQVDEHLAELVRLLQDLLVVA